MQLKQQKAQYNAIFKNLADAYIVIDLSGRVLKMNDRAKKFLGYNIDKEKFNLMQIALPQEMMKIATSFQQLIKEGVLTEFRSFIKTKTNVIKYVQVNASIIYNDHQKPVAAQGIVRDITEDYQRQQDLLKSEKRLSTLVSNHETGIVLSDENCEILLMNEKVKELFEITEESESLRGAKCSEVGRQAKELFLDNENFVSRLQEVITNKKTVIGDVLKMKNGKTIERDFTPIYIDDLYHGHLWTYKDVTLQRKYKKGIEAEQHKYQDIASNTKVGLLEIGLDKKIKMVNKRLQTMYGLQKEELIGKKIDQLFPYDDIINLIEKVKGNIDSTGPKTYDITVKSTSGEKRFWMINVAPNFDVDGNLSSFIVAHLDVTYQRKLKKQKDLLAEQLDKTNEDLQDYMHMVSHDLKAPLRNIDTLAYWFSEDYKDKVDSTGKETLKLIRSNIERMERLISGILSYSSLETDEVELYDIDLNILVDEVLKMVHVPERISVEIKNKLPVMKGDKFRFIQLFRNLIHNAVIYNEKKEGTIEISSGEDDHYFNFCIKDNGKGIPKEYLGKIFGVFQKLDNSMNSSGIGLSIVKKIVTIYQGEIHAKSKQGKGTEIFFSLKKI